MDIVQADAITADVMEFIHNVLEDEKQKAKALEDKRKAKCRALLPPDEFDVATRAHVDEITGLPLDVVELVDEFLAPRWFQTEEDHGDVRSLQYGYELDGRGWQGRALIWVNRTEGSWTSTYIMYRPTPDECGLDVTLPVRGQRYVTVCRTSPYEALKFIRMPRYASIHERRRVVERTDMLDQRRVPYTMYESWNGNLPSIDEDGVIHGLERFIDVLQRGHQSDLMRTLRGQHEAKLAKEHTEHQAREDEAMAAIRAAVHVGMTVQQYFTYKAQNGGRSPRRPTPEWARPTRPGAPPRRVRSRSRSRSRSRERNCASRFCGRRDRGASPERGPL